MAKEKNDRCPLQAECEKKCTYKLHELDCPYYHANARPGYEIEDQEELRWKQYKEAEEAEYWEIDDEEKPEEQEEEQGEPEDEAEQTAAEIAQTPKSQWLDGPRGTTEKIKQAMYDAAKSFVYIGFLLWEVKEYKHYLEKGYGDVYEYAEIELGFKKTTTKNFINVAETFGNKYYKKDANIYGGAILPTMYLQPEYKDFNYSQLCEMLAMSEKKRALVSPNMTIKQIREIKREPEPDLPPNMETIPIELPEDHKEAIGQTSDQPSTKAIELTERQLSYLRWVITLDMSSTPDTDIDYKTAETILDIIGRLPEI